METTIGNILINEKLPPDMRDYSRVITGKELGKIAKEVGNKYPERYGEIVKDLKDLGDEFATQLGSSFSLSDFKPDQSAAKVYAKYARGYAAINKMPDSAAKDTKRKELNLKIESEINTTVAKNMGSDKNRFTMWGKAGAKGGASNFRQMLYASGNQVDVKKDLFPHMSKRSLSEGLSPSDFFITSLGARTGVVGSFNSVKEPGAYAKELYSATNDMIVTATDCGDTEGDEKNINDIFNTDRYLACNTLNFKRNDLIDHLMLDTLKKKGLKTISVRSPSTCKATRGICAMCYGPDENNNVLKVGETIGLSRSQAIAEPLTQLALSAKHSGGVVGTKSAFETVTQLFHAPENFAGGAIITHHSGTVTKIDKATDGGVHVYIGEHEYYLSPKQPVIVKKGQEVKKGEPLSEGLINPKELTALLGIKAGRSYLSEAVRKTYADNNVSGHAKVYETIVRATMNHGIVEDVGDYDEALDIGDTVAWELTRDMRDGSIKDKSPYNAITYRLAEAVDGVPKDTIVDDKVYNKLKRHTSLKVYKIPAKIKPVMVSTDQSALGKDFVSAMNYRNIKRVLEKAVTTGGVADIHGYSPSTAYAYGAEFRHGENGTF